MIKDQNLNSTSESDLKVIVDCLAVCGRPDDNSTSFQKVKYVLTHIFVLSVIIINIILCFQIYRRLNLFPMRERSPYLAFFQCLTFLCSMIIPYFLQLYFLKIGNLSSWDSATINEIPTSRIFMKAIYSSTRILSYFSFIFRYELNKLSIN